MRGSAFALAFAGALASGSIQFEVDDDNSVLSINSIDQDTLQLVCGASTSNLCEVEAIKADVRDLQGVVANFTGRLSTLEQQVYSVIDGTITIAGGVPAPAPNFSPSAFVKATETTLAGLSCTNYQYKYIFRSSGKWALSPTTTEKWVWAASGQDDPAASVQNFKGVSGYWADSNGGFTCTAVEDAWTGVGCSDGGGNQNKVSPTTPNHGWGSWSDYSPAEARTWVCADARNLDTEGCGGGPADIYVRCADADSIQR